VVWILRCSGWQAAAKDRLAKARHSCLEAAPRSPLAADAREVDHHDQNARARTNPLAALFADRPGRRRARSPRAHSGGGDRARRAQGRARPVSGTVSIARFDSPLPDAEVAVTDTNVAVRTGPEGRFVISGLAPGVYRLVARAEGSRAQERAVELRTEADSVEVSFNLETLASFAGDVVVEPSRYTLYQQAPSVRASLSREEVERMPHFADDVFRAVHWLPGTTGEDMSSTMNVRGGVADESLILLDGVEIYEGFHLKELFSLTSIIDAEAVDGLEFRSGGYPVQYGNRMSSVVDIRSASPMVNRLSFGVSTTNNSLLSQGRFACGRAEWVVADRRTDLKQVIQWVDPDNDLEPDFSDVFGKFAYHLGDNTVLSASLLLARDKAHYVEQNGEVEELLDLAATMRYGWIGLKTAWSAALYSDTILSVRQTKRDAGGSTSTTGRSSATGATEFLASRLELACRTGTRSWGFDLRRVGRPTTTPASGWSAIRSRPVVRPWSPGATTCSSPKATRTASTWRTGFVSSTTSWLRPGCAGTARPTSTTISSARG
jgi:hypothetical protein